MNRLRKHKEDIFGRAAQEKEELKNPAVNLYLNCAEAGRAAGGPAAAMIVGSESDVLG
jgi:hypothetical protein